MEFESYACASQRLAAAVSAFWVSRRSSRGASLVEYVLLISLMALAVVVAAKYLGVATSRPYSGAASGLAD